MARLIPGHRRHR